MAARHRVFLFLVSVLTVMLLTECSFAVPSYARQTGLACSGCHYTPPELNPAGRRFKLLGYVDRGDDTKVVKADGSKKSAALNLLASLPLSVALEASFTATKSPIPTTQNGSFEFPQDVSLYLAGAWTSHVGSFLQVTYDTQADHFSIDNTDIRFANKTTMSGKELVYGLDFNNNPTVEDLWNDTPAWGYPFIADDFVPTPTAAPVINGLGQDVAGFGGYAMWNNHLYLNFEIYRSEHIASPQPNPGVGFSHNIVGVAPYWRLAWQESRGPTQFEIGTYGMHVRNSPNVIPTGGASDIYDDYTDWAVDTQFDQTLFRKDVLSLRGTYIRENSSFAASSAPVTPPAVPAASPGGHHLNTFMPNVEYHFGNRVSGTFGWFVTEGTVDPLLYPAAAVTGSANGDPRSAGYIANLSYWPWQNLLLAAQYTGYTRFNGASSNYDGSGRSASANNTVYLDVKFLF